MGHDFSVKVDVRDDCDVKKVEIKVMPQGLVGGRDGARPTSGT